MVEEGMGYALTLDKLAPTGNDSVLCFKPLYPAVETSSYFVWKKFQIFSQAAKIFLNKMRETYER